MMFLSNWLYNQVMIWYTDDTVLIQNYQYVLWKKFDGNLVEETKAPK